MPHLLDNDKEDGGDLATLVWEHAVLFCAILRFITDSFSCHLTPGG